MEPSLRPDDKLVPSLHVLFIVQVLLFPPAHFPLSPSLPPRVPSSQGIYDYGFEKPSAIQQRAVLPIIRGHDIIAQSQSGTGTSFGVDWAASLLVWTGRQDLEMDRRKEEGYMEETRFH